MMAKIVYLLLVVPTILCQLQKDTKPSASAQVSHLQNSRGSSDAKARVSGPKPTPERINAFTIDDHRNFGGRDHQSHLIGNHLSNRGAFTDQRLADHSLLASPHTAAFPTLGTQGFVNPNFVDPRLFNNQGGPFLIVPRVRGQGGFTPNLVNLGNGVFGVVGLNNGFNNNFGQRFFPSFDRRGVVDLGNRNFIGAGNPTFLQGPTFLPLNRGSNILGQNAQIGAGNPTFLQGPTFLPLNRGSNILGQNALIEDDSLRHQPSFGTRLAGQPIFNRGSVSSDPHNRVHFSRDE